MQLHEFLIIIATTLTAMGTIIGVARFWLKKFGRALFLSIIKTVNSEDLQSSQYFAQQQKNQERAVADIKKSVNALKKNIADVKEIAHQNEMSIRRNEILMLVNTQPSKVETIEHLHDEYSKRGGNSYITELIDVWRDEYARGEIAKRIKKEGNNVVHRNNQS